MYENKNMVLLFAFETMLDYFNYLMFLYIRYEDYYKLLLNYLFFYYFGIRYYFKLSKNLHLKKKLTLKFLSLGAFKSKHHTKIRFRSEFWKKTVWGLFVWSSGISFFKSVFSKRWFYSLLAWFLRHGMIENHKMCLKF